MNSIAKVNLNQIQDQKDQNENLEGKEIKVPIDMKLFWKSINDIYFPNIKEINLNQINHVLEKYSKHGNK